jgi:hypothetical protein
MTKPDNGRHTRKHVRADVHRIFRNRTGANP